MDTVVLDGVTYLKASVAAKQFRYTADYIGQLCRTKKIDARLVGRTWFVNPDSIKDHKDTRHQKGTEVTLPQHADARPVISRRHEIKPKIRPLILKQETNVSRSGRTERHLKITYEPDEENLLPTLHRKKEIVPRTIKIQHVDAKKLSIAGHRQRSYFIPSELPTVSLSGAIKVIEYPESVVADSAVESVDDVVSDTIKNKDISVDLEKRLESRTVPNAAGKMNPTDDDALEKNASFTNSQNESPTEQEQHHANTSQENLKTTSEAPSSFAPRSVVSSSRERVSLFLLLSPLIGTVLAVGVVFLILSASVLVVANQTGYESKVVFTTENFLELTHR